jgi:hypothetical protein
MSQLGFHVNQKLGANSDFQTQTLLSMIGQLMTFDLLKDVEVLDLSNPLNICLYTRDGVTVTFGQPDDLPGKLAWMRDVLPSLQAGGIMNGTLDVSAKGGPIYSPAEPGWFRQRRNRETRRFREILEAKIRGRNNAVAGYLAGWGRRGIKAKNVHVHRKKREWWNILYFGCTIDTKYGILSLISCTYHPVNKPLRGGKAFEACRCAGYWQFQDREYMRRPRRSGRDGGAWGGCPRLFRLSIWRFFRYKGHAARYWRVLRRRSVNAGSVCGR